MFLRKALFWVSFGLVLALTSTSVLGVRTYQLSHQRSELRVQRSHLHATVSAGLTREADLNKQVDQLKTQISQLTGDATGKDATIASLQSDNAAKQTAIDQLTGQRDVLKSCLDGVTLALVQLTNNGSSQASGTIDGVRDACNKAGVLL